jgi:lysophospholipase L1-like esterase
MLNRFIITVEVSLSATKPAEAAEWLQKFFDYFHPSACAKVELAKPVAQAPQAQPSLAQPADPLLE